MSLKSGVEKLPGYNTLVRPWHYLKAKAAAQKYHYPARKMRVIGVTGTNGKTSTSFFIWKMLNDAGLKAGILTTVGWGVDKIHPQVEHMTTESVEILNQRMAAIRDTGAEFLVLETTSHALMQSRIYGVPIEMAVFTNLTHEHLDYHKTLEKYRAAKMKLFKRAKVGIVNADDESAEYFMRAVPGARRRDDGDYIKYDIISYGIKGGDLCATDIEPKPDGVEYSCGDMKIRTQIPGEFNVYNSLAAVAVGKKLGLADKRISEGIYALTGVNGRMARVDEGQDFAVIVDYAHTPDAIEKVFESIKKTGRLIAVHGGAGRRDASTREPRGEILGRNADIVIITEDDSRDEDPREIAEEFAKGVEKAGKTREKDLFIEIDREKAIKKALELARKDDMVLLLGKGHEKTILRKEGPVEFEDEVVARRLLRTMK